MRAPDLLTFADYGPTTGSGHVTRQIALSAAWKKFGGAAFIATSMPPNQRLASQARTLGVEFVDDAKPSGVVVIDSYLANENERVSLKAGRPLVEFDDFCQSNRHPCDILVDQNFGAGPQVSGRPLAAGSWGLYGSRFALLRPEFTQTGVPRDIRRGRRTIGLLLGGSPPMDLLRHLARKLNEAFPDEEIVVADGSITDMIAFYDRLDVAVTAAGSSVLELMARGVPSVLLTLADNQTNVARHLSQSGLAFHATIETICHMAEVILADDLRHKELKHRLMNVVDGYGAERVATFVASTFLHVRTVELSDAELLFSWANDAETRRNSFDTRPILWDNHLKWLENKITSDLDTLYVVEDGGLPVAHVRFTQTPAAAEISVTVSPTSRGKRYGGRAIRAAVNRYRIELPESPDEIHAFIKPANLASCNAFRAAGFMRSDSDHDPLKYLDVRDHDIVLHRFASHQ